MPKRRSLRISHATRWIRTVGFTMFSLLFSLAVGIGAPTQAQALSNAGEFLFGTSKVLVEDIALCTKYKYPFDPNNNGGFTWNQTGYETCTSESLTTNSLPATLHIKFRVQSIVPDEFLASSADAFISDGYGNRLNIPRWAPSPLVDLDGPFNTRDGIFYAAFSISDPKIFTAGKYSLTIQFWNSQWLKLNGPNIAETPKSFTPFGFSISNPVASTTSTVYTDSSTCVVDPSYKKIFADSKLNLDKIFLKINGITDFTMSGLDEILAGYAEIVRAEVVSIANTTNKYSAAYKGKSNCIEFGNVVDSSESLQTQADNVQSLLDAYRTKAQASKVVVESKEQTSKNCEIQGNSALTSIKKSLTLFSAYEAKVKNEFDFTSPSSLEMFKQWQESISNEFKNIETWGIKLKEYGKSEPDCKSYITALAWVNDSESRYTALSTILNSLQAKAQKSQNVNQASNQNTKEESFADEDGVEEVPQGSIDVTYSSSLSRFVIKVESNLPDETLIIRATKKGARALRFTVKTDEDGIGGLRTKTKLSGYTLVLTFGNEKLDQVRVK
mgnify:CR=1 FL=1